MHEVATLISKEQITLPKPIRQALGVDVGGKVAFELLGDRVVATRVEEGPHEDLAIGRFPSLLEQVIESGHRIGTLTESLASALHASAGQATDPTQDIQGDVAL